MVKSRSHSRTRCQCKHCLIYLRERQSRRQCFVPLDQRSENESSGSKRYERTKEIIEFCLTVSLRICLYGACLKWLLPELSFADRWARGTKLWERDCGSDLAFHQWERSPPTNVSRIRFPNTASIKSWVSFWFSTLLREAFLRVLRFSPLLRNVHFRIPIRSWNALPFLNEFL